MNEELLQMLNKMDDFSAFVDSNEIPNIGLYMDQVTTFMDTYLAGSKRNSQDKTLTKTMINNYAKDDLLPSPDKKKYTKDHMLLLLFIYYFKNILSINDIGTLLKPVTKELFHADKDFTLQNLYDSVSDWTNSHMDKLKVDILDNLEQAEELAKATESADCDVLKHFYFIAMLGMDVYFKKQIMERMIDRIATEEKKASEKTEEKASKKKNKEKGKEKE